MSLIGELKRRHVFKAGAAYLVVAWLAVQAASIGFPAFEAPQWVLRVFILVALLGFPATLVMAWVFDVTPDGMKLDASARGSKRLYAVAAIFVVLALGWYFLGQTATRPDERVVVAPAASPAAAAAAPTTAPIEIPGKSIAVLPFADLSPERNQEYFSDGMAEEILNALAKIEDLKVAGRTSAFAYKGRNVDVREIGAALAVAHVLEGSVRKQGDRVRITAQLIKADDGYHLWSETYDGDLGDVFELQERIARAITGQLEVVLQGGQQARLVPVATTNADAYTLYLQATDIFNRRDGARWPEALSALERAIALDPSYARAHARYATVLSLGRLYMPDLGDPGPDIERHARRAIELDPALGEPHGTLAQRYAQVRQYVQSRELFEHALALEPADVPARFWYATLLVQAGYTRQGNAELDRVLALDPRHPNALFWRGSQHFHAGDRVNAERAWRLAQEAKLAFIDLGLSELAEQDGRIEQAIAERARGYRSLNVELSPEEALLLARGELGGEHDRAAARAWVDRYLADGSRWISGVVAQALLRMDEHERLLRATVKRTLNEAALLSLLWTPVGTSMRRQPSFEQFAEQLGLTPLWDRYGAPDLCRRNADGAWRCD